jgi:hypothetical protein
VEVVAANKNLTDLDNIASSVSTGIEEAKTLKRKGLRRDYQNSQGNVYLIAVLDSRFSRENNIITALRFILEVHRHK